MTDEQRAEHKSAFEKASAIALNAIPIHDRKALPKPNFLTRWRLRKALRLFHRVLELNPENWAAWWFMGKIHQRFGDMRSALGSFERAYQINPSQSDICREASVCAMDLGEQARAIAFSHRAIQIEPKNAGLQANLALALLLGGQVSEAENAVKKSLSIDPSDPISLTVYEIIGHFASNGRIPPGSTAALHAYWKANRCEKP